MQAWESENTQIFREMEDIIQWLVQQMWDLILIFNKQNDKTCREKIFKSGSLTCLEKTKMIPYQWIQQ